MFGNPQNLTPDELERAWYRAGVPHIADAFDCASRAEIADEALELIAAHSLDNVSDLATLIQDTQTERDELKSALESLATLMHQEKPQTSALITRWLETRAALDFDKELDDVWDTEWQQPE